MINNSSKKIAYKTFNSRKESGFSLIEVMVAAVILSIGILGVAGLQIISLKGTHQSHMKDQAANLIHNLTERMNSNKQAVVDGDYVVDSNSFNCATAPLPSCTGSTVNCSSTDIANYDLNTLICGYKTGTAPNTGGVKVKVAGDVVSLVGGRLQVSCVAGTCSDGDIQIEMEWSEQDLDDRQANVNDSIVLNTRVSP